MRSRITDIRSGGPLSYAARGWRRARSRRAGDDSRARRDGRGRRAAWSAPCAAAPRGGQLAPGAWPGAVARRPSRRRSAGSGRSRPRSASAAIRPPTGSCRSGSGGRRNSIGDEARCRGGAAAAISAATEQSRGSGECVRVHGRHRGDDKAATTGRPGGGCASRFQWPRGGAASTLTRAVASVSRAPGLAINPANNRRLHGCGCSRDAEPRRQRECSRRRIVAILAPCVSPGARPSASARSGRLAVPGRPGCRARARGRRPAISSTSTRSAAARQPSSSASGSSSGSSSSSLVELVLESSLRRRSSTSSLDGPLVGHSVERRPPARPRRLPLSRRVARDHRPRGSCLVPGWTRGSAAGLGSCWLGCGPRRRAACRAAPVTSAGTASESRLPRAPRRRSAGRAPVAIDARAAVRARDRRRRALRPRDRAAPAGAAPRPLPGDPPAGRARASRRASVGAAALPALPAARAALILCPANLAPVLSRAHVVVIHDAAALRHPEAYSRAYVAYQRRMLPLIAAARAARDHRLARSRRASSSSSSACPGADRR